MTKKLISVRIDEDIFALLGNSDYGELSRKINFALKMTYNQEVALKEEIEKYKAQIDVLEKKLHTLQVLKRKDVVVDSIIETKLEALCRAIIADHTAYNNDILIIWLNALNKEAGTCYNLVDFKKIVDSRLKMVKKK